MEGRRQQQPGSEDPEEGPLRVEVPECRPGHDRQHEHPGQVTGRHRSRHGGFDDGKGPLVGAPVLRIGGETGPEGGSRFEIGEMEEDQDHGARRRHAHPVTADERRKRDDGRELGEGRERQHRTHRPGHPGPRCHTCRGGAGIGIAESGIGVAGTRIGATGAGIGVAGAGNATGVGQVRGVVGGSGPARGQGDENHDHEQEDADGLEVTAPGRLDHQERRPGEEHEGRGNGAPGPAGYLGEQQTGGQIGERPQYLERDQRPAGERARREHHLREGRVDGGDGRIVDARVPGGANRFEFGRVRGVQVRVDARQLHMSVPEVAIDVVGQKRNAGE